MTWPWQRHQIQPGDVVIRCPQCQSSEALNLYTITRTVLRAGQVVSMPDGARRACQRCPCVYSVSSTGVFRHDLRSLPHTPEASSGGVAAGSHGRPTDATGMLAAPPTFVPNRAPEVP